VLWNLCKISGSNKHEVGLTVVPHLGDIHTGEMLLTDSICHIFPPEQIDGTSDFLFAEIAPSGTFSFAGRIGYGYGLSQDHFGFFDGATAALGSMLAVSREVVISARDFTVWELA
jgi:hypothetical protein